jgi:hypothetical protein
MEETIIDINNNSYGELVFFDNTIATIITSKGKFEKINFTNPVTQLFNFILTLGKLVFQGSDPASFDICTLARLTHNGSPESKELKIAISKNGIVQNYTSVICSGDSVYKSSCLKTTLDLSNGDYIEVFVTNVQDTEAITVKDFKLSVSKK